MIGGMAVTSPGHIARTARRLAAAQARKALEVPPPFFYANIASIAAGQAADGNAIVQVTWRTATVTANAYLSSYTPTVGDRVACLYDGSQILVLGHPIGWQ